MTTHTTPTPEELAARMIANRRAWDAGKIAFKQFRERQRNLLAAAERAGIARVQVFARQEEVA